MKRLFLLRHARAGFGTSDHDRPLSERGSDDSLWLGQYLKKQALLPDHILCSSAKRTRETVDQMEKGSETSVPVTFRKDLYLSSAAHIFDLIKATPPGIKALMIVGHNPGISLLFQQLTHNPPKDARSLKYPTGMLAIIDFEGEQWDQIKSGTGQLFKSLVPSDR